MLSDHRYTAIFGAALLTASGATFAVYRLIGTAAKPEREPVRTVVVAVRDVPVGVPIPREALGLAAWPVRLAPAESYVTADSVVGRVTRAALMSGEPVLATRLAARGAAPGLEGAIDPARRAMAVRVSEAASVSGLVRANSRVDVLVAGRGDAQGAARLLMSDVRVLGVGSVRPPEAPGGAADAAPAPSATTAAIVTLEVTPAQASELAAAETQGAIQVVLRGYGSANDPRGLDAAPGYAPPTGAGGFPAPIPGSGPSFAAGSTPAPARAPATPAVRPAQPHVALARSARSRPESTIVYVYRGGSMSVLRMGVSGPVTGPVADPVPSAPPPPAASADDAREPSVRPVRTADARVGPRAP